MPVLSLRLIQSKILASTKVSKTAIFITFIKSSGDHSFDAVFDSTVQTRRRIKNNDPDYIGSYYGQAGYKDFLADSKKFRGKV